MYSHFFVQANNIAKYNYAKYLKHLKTAKLCNEKAGMQKQTFAPPSPLVGLQLFLLLHCSLLYV